MRKVVAIACFISGYAQAQQQIVVHELAWIGLNQSEQDSIQELHIVNLLPTLSFGIIIDNQGIDESTPGTTAGSALGGAVGNATYVDRAIKNGNYSARNQLGATLIGAILGSTLDRQANSKFHFRYAVRHSNGEIKYFDIIQNDAFRHPIGVCVSVPNIHIIEQSICTQTTESVRSRYIGTARWDEMKNTKPPTLAATGQEGPTDKPIMKVKCTLKNLPAVYASESKCLLIGGTPDHENK
ncbi:MULTISPECIES: hypothetical protein [unclassified Duganella]|uniref:hypothetical protein n=1 Tax=unclassified Duganella TaxID=2636909 RepID=UPI0011C1A45D|nr:MULTISPECIES: hypothetical protein [unclassified Duganella]